MRHLTHQTVFGLVVGLVLGLVLGTGVLAVAQLWPSPYDETNRQIWQNQQQYNQQEILRSLQNQDFERQMQQNGLAPGRPPC